MREKRLNLVWAGKVLKAKGFVVLTDKESFIALDGINPNNLNDMLILQAQQASIESFMEDLKQLLAAHEQRVRELGGQVGITREKSSAKTTGKNTKVPKKTTKR